jgi:hypothetical protein
VSQAYRLVVHCDENLTEQCAGLAEYASPDRLGLARKADEHLQSGWLRGYRDGSSYDVCPACRVKIDGKTPPKEKSNA